MTAPRRSEYDLATERELIMWPGVTCRQDRRSKHCALILTFRGEERMMTYPATGSDVRGPRNHVRDMRAILRGMGAYRVERTKSTAPRRGRNRTTPNRLQTIEHASGGPRRDPWEPLRAMIIEGAT
jgi:hypothetical protein